MGPIDTGPCNIAIFIVPMDDLDEDIGMAAAHIATTDSVAGDLDDLNGQLLPVNWKGEFKCHLYPIERFIADLRSRPGVFGIGSDAEVRYAEEGVTHIALLQGPLKTENGQPWTFDTHKIDTISAMVMYCAERSCYRLMHCEGCAYTFQAWIGAMQGEWNESQGLPKGTPTLN